jgi:beta-glucanase (GH16 family)
MRRLSDWESGESTETLRAYSIESEPRFGKCVLMRMNLFRSWMLFAGLFLAAVSARAADWKLVWSDEFNYTGLPDPAKWGYEEGFVRNHESQYYTRRLENARVENGCLVIECRKEEYTPADHAPVHYTSASLNTLGKESWESGRLEIRAKIPQGKGVWPAFWTLGTNITTVGWPRCGESDIMENVGKEPNNIYGTLHFRAAGKHESDGGKITTPSPFDDFHIYAIEWFPDHLDFYFDEQKYHTVMLDKAGQGDDNPFRKPHYILLNFALGGEWGGAIDDAIMPQKYLIDYVRVYQQESPVGK